MRTILLFFALCCKFFICSGSEDRDDSFIVENNKNIFKIDIKEPFLQVAVNVMTLSRQHLKEELQHIKIS
jgi:hypothetical protein